MESHISRTAPVRSIDLGDLDEPPLDQVGAEDFYESYEPKGTLGKGLSSVVRRCVHRDSGKQYAVKFIDKMLDRALVVAVRTEIETLQCVSHEYIIKLHEWFESPVYFFLVFELASHGELFEQLNKAVRFSELRSRLVMKQLLLALEHIHSKGIVHRDVKPENILLGDGFNVRLSDFGFAVKVENDTSLRELCGTPGYMAPEVLKCATYPDAPSYGRPVDLWACGVILYTMLAGFPPFWHRKQLFMLRLIMEGRYSFEAPEWHGISDSAKSLIRLLLVVSPARRLTVEQALTHPFIVEEGTRSKRRRMILNRFVGAVDAIVAVKALNRGLSRSRSRSRTSISHADRSSGTSSLTCDSLASSRAGSPPSSEDSDSDDEIPTLETAPEVPYEHPLIRSAIDGVAFRVYGHWVKKSNRQNRAAMFENQPKSVAQRVRNRMTAAGSAAASAQSSRRSSPLQVGMRQPFSPLPHIL